ncbi:GntR family transcriptional regulator [Pseudolactococcus reticulitermitis]|uniref:HTH gntR-type domain-containing protein n=1 Tax=Pseudolactococcus reticulitermitis TaxID=2025039 RepID=A0A224XDP9_9LACT|nr:GntR family transcriptional regulator [Lactococcus reticulitermitis]GAX47765.1 hypothetical protein RsY01_1368 [Lactococcus reticulitermitis]
MKQRNQILYQKVFDALKSDLIKGKYKVGSLFPTENELVEIFGVSKITIRRAVDLLVERGYLFKQSGSGTKVISNRPVNTFNSVKAYIQILVDMGFEIRSQIVYVGKSEDSVVNKKFEDEQIYEIHRIFYLDDVATFFVKHYFPVMNTMSLPKVADDNFSLYTFLVKQNFTIHNIEDTIIAQKTPKYVTEVIPDISDICLKRSRLSFDDRHRLVEYSIIYCDSEKTPYFLHYEV